MTFDEWYSQNHPDKDYNTLKDAWCAAQKEQNKPNNALNCEMVTETTCDGYDDDKPINEKQVTVPFLRLNQPYDAAYLNVRIYSRDNMYAGQYHTICLNGSRILLDFFEGTVEEAKKKAVELVEQYVDQCQNLVNNFKEFKKNNT